jgi:hypothetical protein
VQCPQIVQTSPILEECIRTPSAEFFDHIGGYSRDQVEGGATNTKAMASDAGIVLVRGTKNFVDATDEF